MSSKRTRKTQKVVTPHRDERRRVYVLRWTDDYGKRRQEATNYSLTKANYKKAMLAAHEKERELASGPSSDLVTWLDFQIAYEKQYLSSLGESSFEKWNTVVNLVDEYLDPVFVQDLDSRRLSKLYGKLREHTYGKKRKKLSEATIASYFRTLLASLSWAAEQEMIPHCPKLRVAKQSKRKAKKMKGRPIRSICNLD